MKELPIDHPPVKGMKNGAAMETSSGYWKDITRWVAAGAAVLVAHAAGAYALHAAQPENMRDGEPPAAIMMELDPIAQAPEMEADAAVPVAEALQNPQDAEIEPEKPIEQAEPEEIKSEAPVEEPAQTEPVEETVPEVAEAPKPEVVLPKKVEKPVVKKEEPKPEQPKQQPKPKPKQQTKKAAKAEQNQTASAPQINAKNSSRVAANANRQSSASAGVTTAKWQSKVQAHLERKKRAAQRKLRGEKGIVQIAFVIDGAGNIVSSRVAGSSGSAQIDQAALVAVKAASPVPAPPPAMGVSRLPMKVPFKFN